MARLLSSAAMLICASVFLFGFDNTQAQSKSSNPEWYRLGPETLVSTNNDGGALRCEPSVGIAGDNIVVAWNDSWGGAHGASAGTAAAWATSRDAGKTFQFGGYLPPATADQAPDAADSQIVTDGEGNFYLEILSWQRTSHTIFIYFMDHKNIGQWQRVVPAVTTGFDSAATGAAQGAFLDRPFLSIDATGTLSLVFTMGDATKGMQIDFVSSRDHGATWSSPVNVSVGPKQTRTGASVARVGERIVITWCEGGDGTHPEKIWYAASSDGGKTFQEPKSLYEEKQPLGTIPGYVMGFSTEALFSLSGYTTIVATGRAGANPGFSLAAEDRTGVSLDVILFQYDGTKNVWSGPVRVNREDHNGSASFPALTAIEGSTAVLHYFRAGAVPSGVTDVFLTVAEGALLKHVKLNTVSSDWTHVPGDKEHAPVQRNFGDYISVASSGRRIAAVWTDGRDGKPRIYCRVLDLSSN